MSAWIRTADMLPQENNVEVLVMIEGASAPTVLTFDEGKFYDEHNNPPYKVTHWQHLPDPPKE